MNRARNLAPQLLIYTVLPLTLLLAAVAVGGLRLHQGAMRQMSGERNERGVPHDFRIVAVGGIFFLARW